MSDLQGLLREPQDGASFAVSVSTLMAATILGGPAAGAWVGLIGTTELRELRLRIPWYGTLANRGGVVMPAAVAGIVMWLFGVPGRRLEDPLALRGRHPGAVVGDGHGFDRSRGLSPVSHQTPRSSTVHDPGGAP